MTRAAHAILAGLAMLGCPAHAETLRVGPGRPLAKPSDAAAIIRDGDTVTIDPATYYDCSVWRPDHLTIEASGVGAVLTDTACEGKAAFVIRGNDVVVRNLTFARIRVADQNGAGIRGEGGALTVIGSHFVNDQVGILAASGELRVVDCEFDGNGIPGAAAGTAQPRGHDIQAGRLDLLRVTGSHLQNGRGLAAIDSQAEETQLLHNDLSGPAPLVSLTDGGGALIEANSFVLMGANTGQAAVLIAENGDQGAGERVLRANTLSNHGLPGAALVRDWSARRPALDANIIAASDLETIRDGAWLNYAKSVAHHWWDRLHRLAGIIRHGVAVLIGRGRA